MMQSGKVIRLICPTRHSRLPLTRRFQKPREPSQEALGRLVLPPNISEERMISVCHWTDELFSFRLSRPTGLRFRAGEFVLIGLVEHKRPILRAYYIASATADEGLNFLSVKVPDGPLTSRLRKFSPGDSVLVGKKSTGSLILEALKPGLRLYLLSTGTGIAPFASIVRERDTYERFGQVILAQSCRKAKDTEYCMALVGSLPHDPLVGDVAPSAVTYYPSVTQERFPIVMRDHFIRTGCITRLIQTGRLFYELGLPRLSPDTDRVMICGSMAMISDTRRFVEAAGLVEGSKAAPGDYVVEGAFVDRA